MINLEQHAEQYFKRTGEPLDFWWVCANYNIPPKIAMKFCAFKYVKFRLKKYKCNIKLRQNVYIEDLFQWISQGLRDSSFWPAVVLVAKVSPAEIHKFHFVFGGLGYYVDQFKADSEYSVRSIAISILGESALDYLIEFYEKQESLHFFIASIKKIQYALKNRKKE